MIKISLMGLAGTGTSTVGKQLALDLKIDFISSGDMFRELAKEKSLSLEEFSLLSETDNSIDLEFDNKIKKLGKKNKNFVIDSRLAWYTIPDSFKIKLICSDKIRFQRISLRDNCSFKKAKEKTLFREKTEFKRYFENYTIDYLEDENFDLIVDTTNLSIRGVCFKIKKELINLNK